MCPTWFPRKALVGAAREPPLQAPQRWPRLLYDVGQFVGQELLPFRLAGLKLTGAEDNIASNCEGLRLQSSRTFGGSGIRVDAYTTEVIANPWFEEITH